MERNCLVRVRAKQASSINTQKPIKSSSFFLFLYAGIKLNSSCGDKIPPSTPRMDGNAPTCTHMHRKTSKPNKHSKHYKPKQLQFTANGKHWWKCWECGVSAPLMCDRRDGCAYCEGCWTKWSPKYKKKEQGIVHSVAQQYVFTESTTPPSSPGHVFDQDQMVEIDVGHGIGRLPCSIKHGNDVWAAAVNIAHVVCDDLSTHDASCTYDRCPHFAIYSQEVRRHFSDDPP